MNACKAVIEKYDYSKLKDDFAGVFKDLCEDKISFSETEYLWVIPFVDGARGQFLNYNCISSKNSLMALKNNKSGSTNSMCSSYFRI